METAAVGSGHGGRSSTRILHPNGPKAEAECAGTGSGTSSGAYCLHHRCRQHHRREVSSHLAGDWIDLGLGSSADSCALHGGINKALHGLTRSVEADMRLVAAAALGAHSVSDHWGSARSITELCDLVLNLLVTGRSQVGNGCEESTVDGCDFAVFVDRAYMVFQVGRQEVL
uniref:Uncharacterized protein n=1 Tax=Leersia perrieri TaxID=77586 RepID=A0A0D9XTK9_9ORYZ